jgi:glycosyltransferase involved in cell wall biosynthesis
VRKHLRILGTRGVPAAHGGFETFAEQLALYLQAHGWDVTVYCQVDGHGAVFEDDWRGVRRVHIPVAIKGPKGTVVFDWRATRHAMRTRDLCLTLGYNTAVFCSLLRLRGVPNIINMDGVEWRRAKWGPVAKTWFWLNDWAGCWLGNHLVADHPQIAMHLGTRVAAAKITVIAYGADKLVGLAADPVLALGLTPGRYLSLVARAEPENSILEVVRGFSQKKRGLELAVLGRYDADSAYHQAVKAAASAEVRFLGAIYDKPVLQALRFHSLGYVHGHRVGGTNPSLVEALGAGNGVMAHDNVFNRWVVGAGGRFFADEAEFAQVLEDMQRDPGQWATLSQLSQARFDSVFTWPAILAGYEALLSRFLPAS